MTGEPQISVFAYFGLIGCNCTIVPRSFAGNDVHLTRTSPSTGSPVTAWAYQAAGLSQISQYERESKESIIS